MVECDLQASGSTPRGIANNGVVVGLGGNLGGLQSVHKRFLSVIGELCKNFGPAQVSQYYVSSPVGPVPDQPDFLNAVAVWKPDGIESSNEILLKLQSIENAYGRKRGAVGGARTLDLDFLFHGQQVYSDNALTLPHPRLLSRAFVLQPLVDLFGEEFVPQGSGRTLKALLAELRESGQEIRQYFPGHESIAEGSIGVCPE